MCVIRICVRIHSCVFRCAQAWCTCESQRTTLGRASFHLLSETVSPIGLERLHVGQGGWSVCFWVLRFWLPPPHWGTGACCHVHFFYVGSGDPNPGTLAFMGSTYAVSHLPSPLPSLSSHLSLTLEREKSEERTTWGEVS